MTQLLTHVQELAEGIGPRPATTDAEAQAADYIQHQFEARGLETERQEFDCPRTYGWAFALYHALTVGSAVLAGWFAWPAFVIAVVVAVVMFFDLSTRWGLSGWLPPKGPSQNVIARHMPKLRRGERLKRVVIVAHYDSARASLAFSPGLVKNFSVTFGLMKWLTALVPVAILVTALPWTQELRPWTWYVTLAVSAYLVVPLFINVHRELFMSSTDGANDNASGVAVMLEVMARIVPEPEDTGRPTQPIRRSIEAAEEADVVLEDALLSYTPLEAEGAPVGPLEPAEPVAPAPARMDTFDDLGWETGAAAPVEQEQERFDFDAPASPAPPVAEPEPYHPEPLAADDFGFTETERPRRRGLGGLFRRKHRDEPAEGADEWLGVDDRFDVRQEGRRLGSWNNLGEDEAEEDEWGRKGGAAGPVDFEDPGFASEEAARIRRRVTQGVDRELAEKEIWFVATGAEEAGTWGMRAFIAEYADDLADSLIINIDNVGAGSVYWITEEGMTRRLHCDRRLASAARRVAREAELPVKGRPYRGLSTDATPALARGLRAMSVMAFDINGRLPNWHWRTDTVENVQERTLEVAADLVTGVIREI
ncbi:MAG: hypothetical protein Kow0067_09260 [Coriobacteriia bacterium]